MGVLPRAFRADAGSRLQELHGQVRRPRHPLRAIIDATPTVGVKTFLVAHFGKPCDVTVTSEPGKGSVFTVRLPGSVDS